MVDGSGGENDHQLLRYKGSGTGFADTDTVGDAYTPAGGAQVLVGVDSTAASVATAVAAISNGSLPGQVPGLGLINAANAASDALAAYSKSLATDKASFDLNANGTVTSGEADTVLGTAKTDRADAVKAVDANLTGNESIARLNANVTDATTANNTAKAAVVAIDGGSAAITAYESAVSAQATLVGSAADQKAFTASVAAAEGGLNAALGGDVTLTTLGAAASTGATTAVTFANVAAITEFLADPANETLVGRTALVTELNKVATYGAAEVSVGNKALAIAKADALVSDTSDDLANIGTTEGSAYISTSEALATATKVVAAATAGDATIADAQAVVDQFTALNKSVADASKAITDFEAANTKVDIHNISVNDVTTSATKSDIFYFGSKVTTADVNVSSFGAGDKIVISSALTYNSGALSTGDNNKAEFFLVQKGNDTLVILESENYGSSTVQHTATTDTAAVTSTNAAVITLTGVSLDHLAVDKGVVSYVA